MTNELMNPFFSYRSTARSHPGMVRRVNQDCFADCPDIGLWAVADGMGGHAAGEIASRMVCETLAAMQQPISGRDFIDEVKRRVQDVHATLKALAAEQDQDIMGTTIAVLLALHNHYACLWAGDSRLYRLRHGQLEQVTRDHSYVQGLIEQGAITASQAERHPMASIVPRAVGASPEADLELEVCHGPLAPGDILLICSDGLTKMVSDREIERILNRYGHKAADSLIEQALSAGGRDNITVVVVTVDTIDDTIYVEDTLH